MILDVDGCWTDGTLWYGARGIEELKGFHSATALASRCCGRAACTRLFSPAHLERRGGAGARARHRAGAAGIGDKLARIAR